MKIRMSIIMLSVLSTVILPFDSKTIYSPFSPGVILAIQGERPSVLSIVEPPASGIQTLFPASVTFILSCDKFTIPSPLNLIFLSSSPESWIAQMLQQSFNLSGLSPVEVSKRLTEKLHNGIYIDSKVYLPLIKIAGSNSKIPFIPGWAVSIIPYTDGFVHLPGSLFALLFSSTDGLQQGNTLNFSDLTANMEVATDFRITAGRRSGKSIFFLPWLNTQIASGFELLYRMGHAFIKLETNEGKISYTSDNILRISGHSLITTAGIGLHDNYHMSNPFSEGLPVNGHGIGASGGVCFYNEKYALSCDIIDFGIMRWKTGIQQSNIFMQGDSLYLFDVVNNPGDSLLTISNFKEKNGKTSMLNSALLINFSYRTKYSDKYDPIMKQISSYRIAGAAYKQPLTWQRFKRNNRTIAVYLENGFLEGTCPFRIGWIYQDRDNYSSYIELEQMTKGLSFKIWYHAMYDYIFRWRKGGVIGISSHFFWNFE